jgi:ethanolamine-phosphate cytidylyltransferase
MPHDEDVYAEAKQMGIYKEIGPHEFEDVNASTIVQRIMKSRDLYEARQKAKGMKAEIEAVQRQRELEEEQKKN